MHLPIGMDSLEHAAILTVQLISAIMLALILSCSTAPSAFIFAIEWFAKPLSLLKIRTSEMSLTVMMALRFVPVFQQELHKIRDAQVSRGVNFLSGTLLTRGRRLIGIFHPAFIATLKRSEILAQTMSARGFEPGRKRTHFYRTSISRTDAAALLVIIIFVVVRHLLVLFHAPQT